MHISEIVLADASRESSAVAETVCSVLRLKGTEVWSIAPEETVYAAVELMAERGIGALVVLDGFELAGIVTERDYARKVVLRGRLSKETAVGEIMTSPVVVATPEMTIGQCLRTMTEYRFRHLPVLECARVVGIVSMGDLVSSIISAQAATIEQLSNYISGVYPA